MKVALYGKVEFYDWSGNGSHGGAIPGDLHGQQRGVLTGGQAHDLEPSGIRVHDCQRASPDRPGRTEDRDSSHPMGLTVTMCRRNR